VLKGQQVPKVRLDRQETLDLRVHKELKEQLDILALKELSDQQVDKVLKVPRVILVHKVH
jgi:hypothetical protein